MTAGGQTLYRKSGETVMDNGREKLTWKDAKTVLHQCIKEAGSIAVSGHVNPDGDCIGACLGLYSYVKECCPEKQIDVYLEEFGPRFFLLNYADRIRHDCGQRAPYDLFIALDCSDAQRLGPFQEELQRAEKQICIDHHASNEGFADLCVIDSDASSTCEILYRLFEKDAIGFDTAQCLYLGIVHDTGVFKHSNTTKRVMEIAGSLIQKGVRPDRIIDETFYKKTYLQNQILGRALVDSVLALDGRVIYSVIPREEMALYGIKPDDLDGVIDQLRVTEGVSCAVLISERDEETFKVSLRSNDALDVSQVARHFDGGGHVKAAGCTVRGPIKDVLASLLEQLERQLAIDGIRPGSEKKV